MNVPLLLALPVTAAIAYIALAEVRARAGSGKPVAAPDRADALGPVVVLLAICAAAANAAIWLF